jgi:peroxiredoxin/predicted 2-oxoglutarate/Fe(II)-dependent dioxygenase YbiX
MTTGTTGTSNATAPPAPLTVGDWIHPFTVPAHTGKPQEASDLVGRPVVMFFYPRLAAPGCVDVLRAWRDALADAPDRAAFAPAAPAGVAATPAAGLTIVGVGADLPDAAAAFAAENRLDPFPPPAAPFVLLSDPNGRLAAAYGVANRRDPGAAPAAYGGGVFLVDRNARVAAVFDRVDTPARAAEVLAEAKRLLFREEPRQVVSHAPVLLIPNVLPPDVCRQLIRVWETEGNEDSGFMKQVDGRTVEQKDYGHKIRRDHFMRAESEARRQVKRYVGGRVLPEIQKAYNYDVTRFEDFRIACYDAGRGGYFRPHRDNTTDGTAHRRFAMSLLLNDGGADYEGGFLRFPEYGAHVYRPAAGGAVIFSCSLLHEATDVTAGRRFVLLSFFYGEREAKIREEYNKRTGGQYRAGPAKTIG